MGDSKDGGAAWVVTAQANTELSAAVVEARDSQGAALQWLDIDAIGSDGSLSENLLAITRVVRNTPEEVSSEQLGTVLLILSERGQSNLRGDNVDQVSFGINEALTRNAVNIVHYLIQNAPEKCCPELLEGILRAEEIRRDTPEFSENFRGVANSIRDTLQLAQEKGLIVRPIPPVQAEIETKQVPVAHTPSVQTEIGQPTAAHGRDEPLEPDPTEVADKTYLQSIRMNAHTMDLPRLALRKGITRGEAFLALTEMQRRVECLKLGLPWNTPWRQVAAAQMSTYTIEWKRDIPSRQLPTRRQLLHNVWEKMPTKRRQKLLAAYEKASQEWLDYQQSHSKRPVPLLPKMPNSGLKR